MCARAHARAQSGSPRRRACARAYTRPLAARRTSRGSSTRRREAPRSSPARASTCVRTCARTRQLHKGAHAHAKVRIQSGDVAEVLALIHAPHVGASVYASGGAVPSRLATAVPASRSSLRGIRCNRRAR
eukprot:6195903-Pleurochrysis_carterae.AAC.3